MTIRVDEIRGYDNISDPHTRRNGRLWSHLNADTEDELHAFAARLGLKRAWYQQHKAARGFDPYLCHYDIVPSKRALALRLGAVFVPIREQAEEYLRRKNLLSEPGA